MDINRYFEENGTTLFAGRNTIKRMEIDGEMVVVKRFRQPNIFQKIVYTFFRKTKAYRAFHNGEELTRRGFRTPRPIKYIETRRAGLIDWCYYITTEINMPPIEDWLYRDDWDRDMAQRFARFAAQLHDKGVLHWDLNDTNVRVEGEFNGSGNWFWLIDINRMEFYDKGVEIPLEVCMDNLTRFTGRMDLFEYVVREYARARELDEDAVAQLGVRIKTKHDVAWKRRKRIGGMLKKIVRQG